MVEMIWQLKSQLQWLFLAAIILVALWRGATPERQVAAVFVFMFVTDRAYHGLFGKGQFLWNADLGHILIDGSALIGFVLIALRANRVYPICLASLQLMTVVSHIVRAISPAVAKGAYAILIYTPSYLEVLVFGLGVVFHLARARRYGQYRSWRPS